MKGHGKIALASGVVVVAVVALSFVMRPLSQKQTDLAARQLAMERLGKRIAELRPACKVLVLCNPFAKQAGYFDGKSQFERAGLRGLSKGLGGSSVVQVVFPGIRPEYLANPQSVMIPPDSRTPLSFVVQPDSIDQLADAHRDRCVIVSLIGLPAEADQLKVWSVKDQRCFALLNPDLRLLGPPQKVVEAFQSGKLLAAVVENGPAGEPLLVTRDNVVEVLNRQPNALGY